MRRRFREVREVKEITGIWTMTNVHFNDTIMFIDMKFVDYGVTTTELVEINIDMDVYSSKLTPYLKEEYLTEMIRNGIERKFGSSSRYSSEIPANIMRRISDHYKNILFELNREVSIDAQRFMDDLFEGLLDEFDEETDNLPDEIDSLPDLAELPDEFE